MPLSRADLLTEALSWEGTPYHHQASLKLIGADCIGFLIGVCKNVHILDASYDPGYYSPEWHLHHHEERLKGQVEAFGCVEKPLVARLPADLLLFQFGKVCAHSALLLPDDYLLHAARDFGAVVRHRLAGDWLARLRHVYTLPGVV